MQNYGLSGIVANADQLGLVQKSEVCKGARACLNAF